MIRKEALDFSFELIADIKNHNDSDYPKGQLIKDAASAATVIKLLSSATFEQSGKLVEEAKRLDAATRAATLSLR